MRKFIHKTLCTTLCITIFMGTNTFALANSINQDTTIYHNATDIQQYSIGISRELNENEIQSLLQENPIFAQRYQEQINNGARLESVTVTPFEIQENTRERINGNIYDSTYRQPTIRKTIYLKNWLNTAADLDKYLQVGLGWGTDFLWIPVTLFGIKTDGLFFAYDNGREEILQDETYHSRSVTYIENSNGKEWAGYEAGYSHIALSITHVHEDANKNKFHETVNKAYDFYSPNYNNKSELLKLARTLPMYDEEDVIYPDNIYLN